MGYPGKQGKGGIEGVGKQDGPQQRHRHSSVVWGHQVEEASMRQGAPRQGLRRQGLAVPFDMVALKHFPNIDKEKAMSRPILYSNWLSKVTHLHRVCSAPFLLSFQLGSTSNQKRL